MGRSKKRRAARVAAMNAGQTGVEKEEAVAVEEPARVEEPVVGEPARAEEPRVEEPVVEEPVRVEEPVVEEPAKTEECVVEEPAVEEPEVEEPVVEEPVKTEESKVEEPAAEELIAEEPMAEGKQSVTKETVEPVAQTYIQHKPISARTVSVQLAVPVACIIAIIGVIIGFMWHSHTVSGGDNGAIVQAGELSGGDYDTVLEAVSKRFEAGGQFYYTGNVNGQYSMSGYAMDDSSTLITTHIVPADYDSADGSEPVEYDEVPTDYLSADGKYYVASVSQSDSGYTTTWVDAGEEVSKYATYLRDLSIPTLVKQATSIRYAARINLDSDLVGVEIYELEVGGDALTDALSIVQKAQYTYLHNRAVEAGDSEFADQNEAVLKSMQMNNQMADGSIEIGVKDGNLYYFGISTGGGGYSYISQYTFKDLLPYMPETPDVSNAVDIYQDAKEQYDAQMEAYAQYQQSQLTESEDE